MSKALILGNGPSLHEDVIVGSEFTTVYGVNRSYEVMSSHVWVTADELAMMKAIDHFSGAWWPREIVTTIPVLQRVAEQRGVIRYRSKMQVFPMAGFSGTLAMRAAALQGHDEIYLLGFDGGDASRFYESRSDESTGTAYNSLRDTIVEGFPEVDWFLYDTENGWQKHERKCEISGWVR